MYATQAGPAPPPLDSDVRAPHTAPTFRERGTSPTRMKQVLPALLSLLAVQSLICFASAAAPVLVTLAAADLNVDPVAVGVFATVMSAIAAIASLACGGVIAVLGPMRTSQLALIASAIGLLMLAVGTAPALLAAVVLLGVAFGPSQPAGSVLLLRFTPKGWTNIVFSIRQMGVPIGIGLAGAVLPPLALAFGWRWALVAAAAGLLLVTLLLQPWRARLDAETRGAKLVFPSLTGPLKLVWSIPRLRRLVTLSFVYSMLQSSLITFLVIYLNAEIGLSLVLAGLILTITQVTAACGRLFWGIVADRWSSPRVVLGCLGLAMSVGAWLTASFTPAWPIEAIIVVAAAFGGTAVGWNGVYVGQLAQSAPAGRVSEVGGAGGFAAFSGVTAGPLAFTILLALTGSYAASFALIACLTASVGLWLLLAPPSPAPN